MLRGSALLARLTIRRLGADRTDRKAGKLLAEHSGAKADAVKVKKLLVPAEITAKLAAVTKASRRTFERLSLPWSDEDGWRLVPSVNLQQVIDDLALRQVEWSEVVEQYAAAFEKAKRDRMRLGGLYNASDYPTSDEVRAACVFEMDYQPLPDSKDIRLDIGDDAMADIQASIEKRSTEKHAMAIRFIYTRVHELLEGFYGQVSSEEMIVRPSTFQLLRQTVDLLPSMNIWADTPAGKALDRLTADLRDRVVVYERATIQDDPAVRRKVAAILRAASDKAFKEAEKLIKASGGGSVPTV